MLNSGGDLMNIRVKTLWKVPIYCICARVYIVLVSRSLSSKNWCDYASGWEYFIKSNGHNTP